MPFLLFAGWPLLGFIHYRFRRGAGIAQSLFLMLVPSFGALALAICISDVLVSIEREHHIAPKLSASFVVFWVALPYLILAVWALRGFRARHWQP